MPNMIICRSTRAPGRSTAKAPSDIVTGEVYLDLVHSDESTTMANDLFLPCARTNWHTQDEGQLIQFAASAGWLCDKGEKPQKFEVGDVVWCR